MIHFCRTMAALSATLMWAVQAPATDSKNAPGIAWGKPVNGLQAGIRRDGPMGAVHAGAHLKFRLVVKSVSDHEIDIGFANAQRIYGWTTREKNGCIWIAPRWRYADEEKIEKIVAGAIEMRLAPGQEVDIPMDAPDILLTPPDARIPRRSPDDPKVQAFAVVRGGTTVQFAALPMTAIVRGEEWLERLETGLVKVEVGK